MATPFLTHIMPSPFGKAFGRKPYIFPDAGDDSTGVNGYHCDYQDSPPRTLRATSVPVSLSPSEKPTDSNESAGRGSYHEGSSKSPSRRSCSLNASRLRVHESVNGNVQTAEKGFEQTETFPIFEDPRLLTEHGSEHMRYYTEGDCSLDQPWNGALNGFVHSSGAADDMVSNTTGAKLGPLKHEECKTNPASPRALDKSLGKTAENFRRWASTFRRKRGAHRQKVNGPVTETNSRQNTTTLAPNWPHEHSCHGKRTSNASSRFVATVKTASMSNDSMSLLPRSHRCSRVSDTRANRSSDPRSSVDSQRPSSISSTDDRALRRSIRRRQVLQELLVSEESYVADLKALHNLFSTLLASIPTISTQTRNAIQRNVTEILHLHEQIVDELHRVTFRATLRERRQVVSPLGPSTRRHRRWQSLDATSFSASTPKPNHASQPPDAVNVRRGSPTYAADPAEVADVARAFKNHMARFFVYEEYCAKYEIMTQELIQSHKVVPRWPSYEAGIEALTNSIASLNQRSTCGKKGLTAGDLLIKPIQRMCKYPLLFSDLHKQTPVVDCPSSHAEVEGAVSSFRELVREINLATDDPRVRERIQRRWLLQDRLNLGADTLEPAQFRMLGHVLLCGVLHVAYQTSNRVDGGYMLCMMFKDYLLVATTTVGHPKIDIVATIYLSDAKVVSTEDGRGTVSIFHQ